MNESLFTNALRPRPDALFKSGTQNERLYRRLLEGPVTNAEIVHDLNILKYTGRLSDVRKALQTHLMDVAKRPLGGGLWQYRLRG